MSAKLSTHVLDTVRGKPAEEKKVASAEKDAEIKLDVSKGPPQVTVPDLTNQPCQQVQQNLQNMNLKVRVDFNPNGTVHSQQPGPGTVVAPQSEVDIQCF